MNAAQIPLDLNKINCSGSFFEDFVENFPDSCNVRDIQTNKYLIINHHMISNCGLETIDDVIGFTPHEVWLNRTPKKTNLNQITTLYIHKDLKLDSRILQRIKSTKHPVNVERFTLRHSNGTIRFEHSIKIGILGNDQKVIAILSLFLDKTNKINLLDIFGLYQKIYHKKEAIQKFLKHFNIERYFDPLMPLTSTETKILISMRDDPRGKSIARKFGVSVTTASNHISHIRSKLASSTLHDVLLKLPAVPEHEHSIYVSI